MLKMKSTMKQRYISDLLLEITKKDFNHRQHNKNTALSKYIWSLKDAELT